MRKSVTQESAYGCGIACYAFVREITYKQAEKELGQAQAKSKRFWVNDLTKALNNIGLQYTRKYVKPHVAPLINTEDSIVLIKRSKDYPVGHYFVYHKGMWMDPWINLTIDNDVRRAKSGFRGQLPGVPMYVILPVNS